MQTRQKKETFLESLFFALITSCPQREGLYFDSAYSHLDLKISYEEQIAIIIFNQLSIYLDSSHIF